MRQLLLSEFWPWAFKPASVRTTRMHEARAAFLFTAVVLHLLLHVIFFLQDLPLENEAAMEYLSAVPSQVCHACSAALRAAHCAKHPNFQGVVPP